MTVGDGNGEIGESTGKECYNCDERSYSTTLGKFFFIPLLFFLSPLHRPFRR